MLQQAVSREAYAAGVPSWVNKAGSQVEPWNADTLSTKESALQHRAILEGKKCHCFRNPVPEIRSPKSGPRNPVPEPVFEVQLWLPQCQSETLRGDDLVREL